MGWGYFIHAAEAPYRSYNLTMLSLKMFSVKVSDCVCRQQCGRAGWKVNRCLLG